MKLLKLVDKYTALLQEYIMIITGILVCVLIVIAAAMRYLFKMDFYGSEEFIMYAAFWLYFIGSSMAARDDGHINADMISAFSKSTKIKNIFTVIKNVVSLIVSGIITWWAWLYIARSIALKPVTAVLKAPVILMQLPIFISFALMDIYILCYLIKSIKALKFNEEVTE